MARNWLVMALTKFSLACVKNNFFGLGLYGGVFGELYAQELQVTNALIIIIFNTIVLNFLVGL